MHAKLIKKAEVYTSALQLMNFTDSFDKHNIYIDDSEIPLGEVYRSEFFAAYSGGSLNMEG